MPQALGTSHHGVAWWASVLPMAKVKDQSQGPKPRTPRSGGGGTLGLKNIPTWDGQRVHNGRQQPGLHGLVRGALEDEVGAEVDLHNPRLAWGRATEEMMPYFWRWHQKIGPHNTATQRQIIRDGKCAELGGVKITK